MQERPRLEPLWQYSMALPITKRSELREGRVPVARRHEEERHVLGAEPVLLEEGLVRLPKLDFSRRQVHLARQFVNML